MIKLNDKSIKELNTAYQELEEILSDLSDIETTTANAFIDAHIKVKILLRQD